MDIGTAKPTVVEQAEVPHHLLDVVDPGQYLNAAEFKRRANAAEAEILGRGRVPILVGGSGMYVDAVLYDYQFPGASAPELRTRLENMTNGELREEEKVDPEAVAAVDMDNRRRVIRAIETVGEPRSRRQEVRPDVLVLGLTLDKNIVQSRVEQRVNKMLSEGFIREVRTIGERYGWENPAFDVIGYRAFREVALGRKSEEEGIADFVRGDMRLYKRQVTWFKRNRQIHWLVGDVRLEADRLVRAMHEV
jgi:tRNA dimethylallyltransferase